VSAVAKPKQILRLPLVAQDDDPGRVVEVQKCGDQRASWRFVFNELSHFLFADSWRSCGIASSVYLLPSPTLFFAFAAGCDLLAGKSSAALRSMRRNQISTQGEN
jgi:hypothetical protein